MHPLKKIIKPISLKNRIIIAFTIQTLIIVFIAFSSILFSIRFAEDALLYDHLSDYLDAYVAEVNLGNMPLIPSDTYVYQLGVDEIPEYIKGLDFGSHELELDNKAYHVIIKNYNNNTYALAQDQTEFEKVEKIMLMLVSFLLALFVLGSFLFSKALAKRIIQPIFELTDKVSNLSNENLIPAKPEYANDEVGKLIDIIYAYISKLSEYLQREKWITGDISHELRTPMMVISSSLDVLKQEADLSQQKKMIYQRMSDASKNINELINTFLLLAREETGKEYTERPVIDLRETVQNTIEQLLPYAEEKGLSIKILADEPVNVKINSNFLSVVVSNIVKNSIFNTREGGIEISLEQTRVLIKDTGNGMPEDIKHFINSDTSPYLHRNNSSLGLGLSIVKRVCEHEKWTIMCNDNEKGGSSFKIVFHTY